MAPGRPTDDPLRSMVVDPAHVHVRSGSFEVVVSDGVAQVTPTDADADLALGIEELGMLYLGGVRPTVLRQAGRVEQRRSGAVARYERLLAWGQAPMQCSEF